MLKTLQSLSIALILTLPMQVFAADDKTSNTGINVVDVQVLLEKSTAVVKIREQIDKKAEEFKKEFSKKEDYFKKKSENLDKQKGVLSKDAYEQQYNDLSKEFTEAQKKVQENRNMLDKAYTEAMQQVETAITDVVKQEAKANNVKVVLLKMQTIYSDDSLDITTKVVDALNKKLPSVTLKF